MLLVDSTAGCGLAVSNDAHADVVFTESRASQHVICTPRRNLEDSGRNRGEGLRGEARDGELLFQANVAEQTK